MPESVLVKNSKIADKATRSGPCLLSTLSGVCESWETHRAQEAGASWLFLPHTHGGCADGAAASLAPDFESLQDPPCSPVTPCH